MKMLWKPNKGLQISEIKEDMFLVEFGDGRDKKKKGDNGDVPLELREATYTPTRL